ncbi:MAG TPA: hypothetical protein V6D06_01960 [Trichocoleus sp.]
MRLPSKRSSLAVLGGLLLGSGLGIASFAAQEPPSSQRSIREAEAQVANWFEAHRDRTAALRAFVQRMPKGATSTAI